MKLSQSFFLLLSTLCAASGSGADEQYELVSMEKGGNLRGMNSNIQNSNPERKLRKTDLDYRNEIFDITNIINLNEFDNEYKDFYWRGTNSLSAQLTCDLQNGDIVTGICGPGWLKFLHVVHPMCRIGGNTFLRAVRCAKVPKTDLPWHDTSDPWTNDDSRFNNGFHTCRGTSEFIFGLTFANSIPGKPSLTCASKHTGYGEVRLDASAKKLNICEAGRTAVCPIGYVATSFCQENGEHGFRIIQSGYPSSCSEGFCSGSTTPSWAVNNAIQCTPIAAYDYKDVISAEPIQEDAEIGPVTQGEGADTCNKRVFSVLEASPSYQVDETFEFTSSSTTEVTETTVTGNTLTESLSATATIGASYGFAKAKISATIGSEIETRLDKTKEYVEKISSESKSTTKITSSFTLPPNMEHIVLRFSANIDAAGDYNVAYNEYKPGLEDATTVKEDVKIGTSDLIDTNYIIGLNDNQFDSQVWDRIMYASCGDIASDFLNRRGVFAETELVEAPDLSQGDSVVWIPKPKSNQLTTQQYYQPL